MHCYCRCTSKKVSKVDINVSMYCSICSLKARRTKDVNQYEGLYLITCRCTEAEKIRMVTGARGRSSHQQEPFLRAAFTFRDIMCRIQAYNVLRTQTRADGSRGDELLLAAEALLVKLAAAVQMVRCCQNSF
jgi:hypothetical protein